MKRILIPTDFSENAWVALKYALILAQKLDSKIYVFHAYNVPHAGRNVMIDIIDGFEDVYNLLNDAVTTLVARLLK